MNSILTTFVLVLTLASASTGKKKRIDLFESKPNNAVMWTYSEYTDNFYFDRVEWQDAMNAMCQTNDLAKATQVHSDSLEMSLGGLYHSKIIVNCELNFYEKMYEVAHQLMRKGHFYFEYADGTTASPKSLVTFQKMEKRIGLMEYYIDKKNDNYQVYTYLLDAAG